MLTTQLLTHRPIDHKSSHNMACFFAEKLGLIWSFWLNEMVIWMFIWNTCRIMFFHMPSECWQILIHWAYRNYRNEVFSLHPCHFVYRSWNFLRFSDMWYSPSSKSILENVLPVKFLSHSVPILFRNIRNLVGNRLANIKVNSFETLI